MNISIKEETLGQRLRAQRIRLGMTQEELAERLYVKKSTISYYETDIHKIDNSMARCGIDFDGLCKAFPNFPIEEIEKVYMQVQKMGNGGSVERDIKCCGSDAR